MVYREISLSGNISQVSVSGRLRSNTGISGNLQMAKNVYVKEIEFNNRFEFPSIGKDNMIYVAKDEHKMYMFNSDTLNYEVIGSDYNEIEIIQGKL